MQTLQGRILLNCTYNYIFIQRQIKIKCKFCKENLMNNVYNYSYILVSWESEATPSATPFFKRAYKISHFPGLWAPWVDLPSFATSSKIWPNFSNKVVEKLMLSKSVNNKKCAPKLVFFNEKKIEKDSDDFWHRKFTLKVQFSHFSPSWQS